MVLSFISEGSNAYSLLSFFAVWCPVAFLLISFLIILTAFIRQASLTQPSSRRLLNKSPMENSAQQLIRKHTHTTHFPPLFLFPYSFFKTDKYPVVLLVTHSHLQVSLSLFCLQARHHYTLTPLYPFFSLSLHKHTHTHSTKADPPVVCVCRKSPVPTKKEEDKKPHIKKPLNAFMLYMKEMRAKVVAECTLKESAAINQILGRRVSEQFRPHLSEPITSGQKQMLGYMRVQKVL